jgi:hypothetical protein
VKLKEKVHNTIKLFIKEYMSLKMSIDNEISDVIHNFLEKNGNDDDLKKRDCIRTVMYALMRSIDRIKIMENTITQTIEKNCKHNWVLDRSTYDPCRSYHMCTICDASN